MKLFPHFSGNEPVDRFYYNEARPSGGNETGPLKIEHFDEMSEEQKTDAQIHAELAKFNKRFQSQDYSETLAYLREIDRQLTPDDIPKLQDYADKIEARYAEKETTVAGDLGLGVPVADTVGANDLGLGLAVPAADDGNEVLVGNANDDPLGLGIPVAATTAEPTILEETETAAFAPDESRCRECATKLVGDFTDYPEEAQGKVVERLVRMEAERACDVNEIDPEEVKSKCDLVLARYEKATAGELTEATNLQTEAKADTESSEKQKEISEYLKNLGDQLTLGQINEALAKADQLVDKDTESQANNAKVINALRTVKSDLAKVTAIAPPDNPQEAAVLQQIVTSTPVSWKAESPSVRYEAILTAIDAGNLSDDTKRRAREALGIRLNPAPRVNSGSGVETALKEGRGTETRYRTERVEEPPGSGQYVEKQVPYEVPLEYDEDHPLEVRPGVEAYKDRNREIMKATAGHNVPAIIDVTGWTAEQKGDLAEVMSFWTATESVGMTGFVQDIYGLNFSESTAFNPDQVRQMKQVITYAFGGFEGHDGDIASFDRQMGLIQYQARLVSETGTATGMENDQASTLSMVTRLGLRTPQGDLNHDVVKAFGAYTLSTYGTGEATTADLQAHLHGLFPDLVEAPEVSKAA